MVFRLSISIIFFIALSSTLFAAGLTVNSGSLKLRIDEKGRISMLKNTADGKDYINKSKSSNLIECFLYASGRDALNIRKCKRLVPLSMEVKSESRKKSVVALTFPEGVVATVSLSPKNGYILFKLDSITHVNKVSHITWGPVHTIMRGPVAEWLGLNRSDNFTIGMISAEPNTDGEDCNGMSFAANFENGGSKISLWSLDHSHPREFSSNRISTPIKGLTVLGSKVAVFGVKAGKNNELSVIEKIERGENLPHPTYHGKWQKRSKDVQKICLWADIQQSTAESCIKLAKAMNAGTICRFQGYYKNWGHFEISDKFWSGGLPVYNKYADKALKAGLGLTTYTLSGFTKPMSGPEPFLAPIPDKRLAAYAPKAVLGKNLDSGSKIIKLKSSPAVASVMKDPGHIVLQIGNELIQFKHCKVKGDEIVVSDGERGYFYTNAKAHKKGSKVKLLYFGGYSNLFPGTVDMNNELAGNIVRITKECNNRKVVLDGFESCLVTGHGTYSKNVFLQTIYSKFKKIDMLYSASNQDNYDWHTISYQSWGEFELEKGFRGTMLTYRLMRQVQLRNNLMPNKMGQYYPEKAKSVDDINWLMARVVGWESGVDLALGVNSFDKNPLKDKICEKLSLWEELRDKNNLSEIKKISLRQIDTKYDVAKGRDGKVRLKYLGRWMNPKLKTIPSSEFDIETSNNLAGLKKCSISWKWTHNPGIYYNCAGLSVDLVHKPLPGKAEWSVTYPDQGGRNFFPMMIVRLPANASGPVKNIRVAFSGNTIELPVTLKPGQYISIPYNIPIAWIYDKNHNVIGETHLPGYRRDLPSWRPGTTRNVTLKYEAINETKTPSVILNLGVTMRNWEKIDKSNLAMREAYSLTTGKPVSSSNHSKSASLANDGKKKNSSRYWESTTNGTIGSAWWQVDMQKPETVSKIVVVTYYLPPDRYYQFTIDGSMDGKNWKQIIDFSKNTKFTPKDGSGYSFNIQPQRMRYIRVNMLKHNHNNFVHLVEVMAYGTKNK